MSLLERLEEIRKLAERADERVSDDVEYVKGYVLGVKKAIEEFEKMLSETVKDFPKPWMSRDFTHFAREVDEALERGEPIPEHKIEDYPQYYTEPDYKDVKNWFDETFAGLVAIAETGEKKDDSC